MTDGRDLAMVEAGLSLLRADVGPPPLIVYDGSVPNPTGPNPTPPPYVLVYSFTGWPDDDPDSKALDGLVTRATVRWICHCVGANAQAAREVAQRVRTQWLNVRPVIAGMEPGFIRYEQHDGERRDETTGVLVYDDVHVYRLTCDT